ncbi:large ribosomal subunit protein uL13c [Cannabis sativa]|uniref:Large ribosomal subunit protein uL13c n=1 Tax=Cannabis sativa TaxID=3483 RepID=A0A7J6HRM1_CANSA|nr:large ribosomal subunit protein uL13c [Cannabis sativa]KAF4397923.1 hypothetical protein G4B88_019644 [Cannabis sativa]
MAILSVSASSCSYILPSSSSSSSPLPSSARSSLSPSFNTSQTPFLGFSVSLSRGPWLPTPSATAKLPLSGENGGRSLQVRCQEISRVPLEQRWMFDEAEAGGPDIWNKTWYPKAVDHINTEKPWYIVDATDKILGRLASTIANHIRGKTLATYTPSVDMGAFVIVVNAEKVAVSGKKRTQKLYRRHSGRPGGMTVETFDQLQQRIPERIIEHAVRGMLPKGRLGRALFNHLKVYKGPDHPHEAQQPVELPIKDKRIQKQR